MPKVVTNNEEVSIDFELTFTLSAKNEKLVGVTFSMLKLEIPDYLANLKVAIEVADKDTISGIMHKLQGITCYIGLPRLKKLLSDYYTAKNSDINNLLDVSSQIKQELKSIDDSIKHNKYA